MNLKNKTKTSVVKLFINNGKKQIHNNFGGSYCFFYEVPIPKELAHLKKK